MPLDTPLSLYHPIKSSDGEGSLETLGPPVILFADPDVQGNEVAVTVLADADVRIGDIIKVPHNLFQ